MKKIILIILLSINPLLSKSQANWSDTAFVHRTGQNIIDGQGNAINLEGAMIMGWLMWEGWVWGANGGFTSETTLYNAVQSKIGTVQANNFRDSVYKNYITRSDIQKISTQCFNAVSIPFNHLLLEDDANPFVYKASGWQILDSLLQRCEDNNQYVVLSMHSAPGGQSGLFTADPDWPLNLWSSTVNQQRTTELWKAIANRYKNRGIIAGYDLLNEPDAPSDSALLKMYNDIIDSVRTVDVNHMLFIQGKQYASDFSLFTSLPDTNMSFCFHFYTWFIPNSSIPIYLNNYGNLSQTMNVPVWCGEWGENIYSTLDTTLKCLKDPAYKIRGETMCSWKSEWKGSSYPYYCGIDTAQYWDKSITWMCNVFAPQPTVAEMQQGISDFITNMKFQNCIFNDTMNAIVQSCPPIGIEENFVKDAVNVYPNPFSCSTTLLTDNLIKNATLTVYNLQGQAVKEINNISGQTIILFRDNLASGLYFIRLTQDNKVIATDKLVITD